MVSRGKKWAKREEGGVGGLYLYWTIAYIKCLWKFSIFQCAMVVGCFKKHDLRTHKMVSQQLFMQKNKIKMALHIYFVTLMRYIDDVTRFLGVNYAICVFWPDNNVVCLIHSCYHVFSIFFCSLLWIQPIASIVVRGSKIQTSINGMRGYLFFGELGIN